MTTTKLPTPLERNALLAQHYQGDAAPPDSLGIVVLRVADLERTLPNGDPAKAINSRLDYRPLTDEGPRHAAALLVTDRTGELPPADVYESIAAKGILQDPVVVRLSSGRYLLAAGNRRVNAWKKIVDQPDVFVQCKAHPVPDDMPDPERVALAMVLNGIENADRLDPEPWEWADYYYRLQTMTDWSTKKIAKEVGHGKSDRHIANLIRVRRNLAPDLWAKFTKDPGKRSFDKLLRIVVEKDEERQRELFAAAPNPDKWSLALSPPTAADGDDEDDADGDDGEESTRIRSKANGHAASASDDSSSPPPPPRYALPPAEALRLRGEVKRYGVRDPERKERDPRAGAFSRGVAYGMAVCLGKAELYDVGDFYSTSAKEGREYEKALVAQAAELAGKEAES